MNRLILFCFLLIVLMAFKAKKKINVWLIGDSTMAWKKPEQDPESGWGEGLKFFFNSNVIVHNHAASGRSTKSFVDEKRWQAVLDSIQPGDYVVMQFGHNDEKPMPALHTDPFTTYKEYLKKFVDETRSKKGIPIICSSIIRRHFDSLGNLKNTHGDYIEASRQIAKETNTMFIDMEAKSRKLVTQLGPEKSKSLFVFCNPGECPLRPQGAQDSTHLNHYGSKVIASLFVEGLKEQKIKLAKYTKSVELRRESYDGNTVKTYFGKALAVVQSDRVKGDIQIKVSSAKLPATFITIKANDLHETGKNQKRYGF